MKFRSEIALVSRNLEAEVLNHLARIVLSASATSAMPLLTVSVAPFTAKARHRRVNARKLHLQGVRLKNCDFETAKSAFETGHHWRAVSEWWSEAVRSLKFGNVWVLTADFWSSFAYVSAVQKPKHCLTRDFSLPLMMMVRAIDASMIGWRDCSTFVFTFHSMTFFMALLRA